MPPQTQNKFYKTLVNDTWSYEVIPDYGNTPYGYKPITASEYLAGVKSMVDPYKAQLAAGYDPNGRISQSYYATLPQTIAALEKRYNEDLAKYGAVAPTATGAGESGVAMVNGVPRLISQLQAETPEGRAASEAASAANLAAIRNGTAPTRPQVIGTAVKPPSLNIPETIDSGVLGSTGTRAGVLASVPKSPAVSPISSLIGTVKPGEQSANVTNLQKALISAGYDIPALSSGKAQYGYYGDQTAAALKKYQADQALIANGGKQIDTSLQGIKKSLNDTLTALNALRDKGITEIPDGADPVAYLNDVVLKSGGGNVKPPTFDPKDVGTKEGLIALFTRDINAQAERQAKMDDLMKQLGEITTAGYKTKVGIEGGVGTKGYVGGQLQTLKEFVATQAMPIQSQVDSLTRQMNISKENFTSAVALAQLLEKMDKPEVQTIDGEIWERSANGTWTKVGGPGKASAGGGFGFDGLPSNSAGNILGNIFGNIANSSDAKWKMEAIYGAATPLLKQLDRANPEQRAGILKTLDSQLKSQLYGSLTGTQKSDYDQWEAADKQIGTLLTDMKKYAELNPNAVKVTVDGLKPLVGKDRNPALAEFLARVEGPQAEIRKAIYGTAVTGSEQGNADNFLISMKLSRSDDMGTIMEKLQNLRSMAAVRRSSLLSSRTGYSADDIALAFGGDIYNQAPINNMGTSISDDFGAAELADGGKPSLPKSAQTTTNTGGGFFSNLWNGIISSYNTSW
jgi:hypothetical protein